jgi:uncharacterized protein (DUF488 family)
MTVLFTIGHGARDIDPFLDLLEGAGIRQLVDVRTAPGSRKHPQFGKDALEAALRQRGIGYVWKGKELGGWRRTRPDSRHTGITSAGFRGYADHMETEEFRRALRWLMDSADQTPTAAMCAESVWWRCHRRMLADAVVAVGGEVRHIMDGERVQPHRLHPAARIEDGAPVYDRPVEDTGQVRLDVESGSA